MPELPETETIARDLDGMVRGAIVASVRVPRPDVLREVHPEGLAAALTGRAIARVWRRAKLVVLDLTPPGASDAPLHLVVQPRFTGGVLVDDGTLPEGERAVVAVTLALTDGRALHYRDVRRLGTVALMSPARFAAYSGALGPEPLDPALDDTAFSGYLRGSRRAIKVVLMDQRRLAGVGNIYANEALWHAGIDPSRDAGGLTPAECGALLRSLREVLAASIALRGTTFRDFQDAYGARGGFAAHLAVYGRADAPCVTCGTVLRATHRLAGRQTVWCPTCQR